MLNKHAIYYTPIPCTLMPKFVERLKAVLSHENMTREDLAELTGLRYTRINNAMNKRGKFDEDELELIAEKFPTFEFWLHTGKELPEAGQISPATKITQETYKGAGKA